MPNDTTPESFKQKIITAHPNGVASDGRRYADIPADELVQKIVTKFPNGVTNDGKKYSDFLPKATTEQSSKNALSAIGSAIGVTAKGALQAAEGYGAGFVEGVGNLAAGAIALPIEAASAVNKSIAPSLGIEKGGNLVSSKLDAAAEAIRKYGGRISDVGRMTENVPLIGNAASANTGIGSAMQSAGGFTAEAAALLAPSAAINKAQTALTAGVSQLMKVAESVPWIGKALGYTTGLAARVAPEAATGFTFGKLKGEDNATATLDAVLFGTASGLGKIGGDAVRKWKGTVESNVMRALGTPGKQSIGQALAGPKKAVEAFKTMHDIAKTGEIKVIKDGVEEIFDPTRASIEDTAQALYQAKKITYDAYTELAKRSSDKGAVFNGDDFMKIYDTLTNATKNSTKELRNAAKEIFNDTLKNYGTQKVVNGRRIASFKDIPLDDIQVFLENLNRSVDPNSKGAKQYMADVVTKQLRQALDDKIMQSTGEGFQVLRNKYTALKAIENQIVKQLNRTRTLRGGSVSDYVLTFGSLDTAVGALTGNWTKAGKGVGQMGIGAVTAYFRNPETYIKRVFQAFDDAERGTGAGGEIFQRFFGAQAKAAGKTATQSGATDATNFMLSTGGK